MRAIFRVPPGSADSRAEAAAIGQIQRMCPVILSRNQKATIRDALQLVFVDGVPRTEAARYLRLVILGDEGTSDWSSGKAAEARLRHALECGDRDVMLHVLCMSPPSGRGRQAGVFTMFDAFFKAAEKVIEVRRRVDERFCLWRHL